jgi:hypothetical protein
MSQRKGISPNFIPRENLERMIAVLLDHLDGHIVITNEEIEDASDVEFRSLFETDEVEMRVVKHGQTKA